MFIMRMILGFAMVFGFANLSVANDLSLINDQSVQLDDPTEHGRYWQCSAHNSHGGHHVYYGARSYTRHQAEHSAVHECEHHEGHGCSVHQCWPTD